MQTVPVLFVLCCLATLGFGQKVGQGSIWPISDARRCEDLTKQAGLMGKRLEVIPGLGWDNLRNRETSQVVFYNYSKCRMTEDGGFLIPDDVFTIPLKSSFIETYAEVISDWTKSSSTTANTININPGLSYSGFSISGSFSHENKEVKSRQIEDEAVTVRVQTRYNRYDAKLQTHPELSPEFRSRIHRIAQNVITSEHEMAQFRSQLLVRDFGTHVITSAIAGATIVKDDFVKRKFMEENLDRKSKILVSASASYLKLLNAKSSSEIDVDTEVDTIYRGNTTHSMIRSQGGEPVVAGSTDISAWTASVQNNMVTLDRAGQPIYFMITQEQFPEIPPSTVSLVQQRVRDAVELYYAMNTLAGCTDMSSPNFSPSANFDDGSCEKQFTNKTFGGVYQECKVSGTYLNNNPCDGLVQPNPKTGQQSCPPGYNSILLYSGVYRGVDESKRHCSKCNLFAKCCRTIIYKSAANYNVYWCSASDNVAEHSGYLFGGLFTSTMPNAVTGDRNCPTSYYPRRLFTDMSVCLSDDFEQGATAAVPFGGFYSCTKGNPLAVQGKVNDSDLDLPHRCPVGYSSHLAGDVLGCSIHYCVGTGALSGPMLPQAKLPPFMKQPVLAVGEDESLFEFSQETGQWMRRSSAPADEDEEKKSDPAQPKGKKDDKTVKGSWSPSVIAVVGVLSVLACMSTLALAIIGIRRTRARRGGRLSSSAEVHLNEAMHN